jgi:hypothetical protein
VNDREKDEGPEETDEEAAEMGEVVNACEGGEDDGKTAPERRAAVRGTRGGSDQRRVRNDTGEKGRKGKRTWYPT